MSSLLLNEDNDIAIIDNSFQLATDETEVEQKIKTVLKVIRGECFLNLSKGLPYVTEIAGKNKNLSLIADLFKKEILDIDVVESLDFFDMGIGEDRVLTVQATVKGNIKIQQDI